MEELLEILFTEDIDQSLRIPKQNTNKLVQLEIYNRFGKRVFKTADINEGWDGSVNNTPQPTGIYVYHIALETLAGRKLSKNGSVVLIH